MEEAVEETVETLDIVEHLKISTIIDTNVTSNQLYTNIINNTLNIEHNILKVNEDISHVETVLDDFVRDMEN